MSKVSIIIPVYNTGHYLYKCVNSILYQTYKDIEVIIVDDGSCEETALICDEIAAKDNRIRLIHKKNEGVSIARNIGLSMVTGEYVGFVDSDRELGNPEGFWTRNGREGWSRENILRRASHIQDVRQNTESGMSLDELSQNPVLDDTIRSYYNNPVQVAQVGSYYVFQSDGRHRTLAAQSLDTYIPVLVTGSYTRND